MMMTCGGLLNPCSYLTNKVNSWVSILIRCQLFKWLSVPYVCSNLTHHFNTSYLVACLGHLVFGCMLEYLMLGYMPWTPHAWLHALDTSCLVACLETSCLVTCLDSLCLIACLDSLCLVACLGHLVLGCMFGHFMFGYMPWIPWAWLHALVTSCLVIRKT